MPSIHSLRESVVEAYLRESVATVGGLALKWVSPGFDGVPDRICIFPNGDLLLVEVKSPSGTLSPLQKRTHEVIQKHGGRPVFVVYDQADVDRLIAVRGL